MPEYKDEYLATVLDVIGNEHRSDAIFAWSIGVEPETLHQWARENDEFAQAYRLAKSMRAKYYEDAAMVYPPALARTFLENYDGLEAKVDQPLPGANVYNNMILLDPEHAREVLRNFMGRRPADYDRGKMIEEAE